MGVNQSQLSSFGNQTLVFIDAGVEDYRSLLNAVDAGISVNLLTPEKDGVEQITQAIAQHRFSHGRISRIYILAHGAPGILYLGNSALSLDTLSHYLPQLQTWFSDSSPDLSPALLLYGCSIAAGDAGQELLNRLHAITGACIAASTHPLGRVNHQPNWELDAKRGNSPSRLPIQSQVLEQYAGVLATGTDGNYRFIDSNEPGGSVSFTDISSTGTLVNITTEDGEQGVDLPFSFNYYGTTSTAITISDNGGLIFNTKTGNLSPNNGSLPRSAPALGLLPFWTDFIGGQGQIYYATVGSGSNRRFIVQWTNVPHQDALDGATFQVVLHEGSNNIDFVYQDTFFGVSPEASTVNYGQSATIGLNRNSGTALQYSAFGSTSLNGITAIRFFAEPRLVNNTLTVQEGQTVTLTSANLSATDIDNTDTTRILFTVSAVQNGRFLLDDVAATSFTQAQVNSGRVKFEHTGGENAPAYSVSVTDGFNTTTARAATITFSNVNNLPVLTNVVGSLTLNENSINTASVIIDNAVTVNDLDSPNFDGGNLTVRYTSGGSIGDQLGIRNSGAITLNGRDVSFSGTLIGTVDVFSNGTNGTNLIVNLTANANATNVKALIENITYQNTSNAPALDRTIAFTINDGDGGTSTAVSTVITITAENDAPVNTIPGAQTVTEDGVVTFSGSNLISVSDPDAGANPIRITLNATNGILRLSTISGLSFDAGSSNNSASMTFSGAIANINAALNGMTYTPTANFNGPATLQIITSDLGNVGTGNILTDTDTVNITVAAVNDTPVNTVPGAQTLSEDSALVFSTANGNAISISDVDVNEGTGLAQVTLSVTKGLLTLAQTTGLSFVQGTGTGNALMTFTGSLANINAALNGLTYRGNTDANGADTLRIVTSDRGNSGDGTTRTDDDSIAIAINAINDAPVNTVPSAQIINEDAPLVFNTTNGNAIRINDVDVAEGTGELQVTLSVNNGVLNLSQTTGLSFSSGSDNNASMTFRGSLANINAALTGLTYRSNANYNGADTLSIATSDLGNSGDGIVRIDNDSVAITVRAVNDAPINTVPGAQTLNEDAQLVFSAANGNAIRISDVDVAEGTGEVEVSLSVTRGTLTLGATTGIQFSNGTSNGTASLIIRGSLANVNTALAGLTYRGNTDFNGADTLSIVTSDLGNSGDGIVKTDSDSVAITVRATNDAPINTVPGAQTLDEDAQVVFSTANGNAIRISDVDVAEGTGEVEVALSVTQGILTLGATAGIQFSNGTSNGTASLMIRGSLANINAALAGLVYRSNPNYNGTDTLNIVTSDLGNSGDGIVRTDSDSVAINVRAINDVPINTVPGAQSLSEDGQLTFSTANGNAIRISDVDVAEGTGEVEVALSVTQGTLTLGATTGIQFSNGTSNGAASLVIRGSLANINAALAELVYRSNPNYNGADTLSIVTSDLGNSGDGIVRTDSDSVAITVRAINDAPINTVPGAQSLSEDGQLTFSTANGNVIRISDVDVAEGTGEVEVTLSVTRGTLTLGATTGIQFSNGTSNGTASLTIRGSLTNVNTALSGLTYRSNANFNGTDTLRIVTSDRGNSGDGTTRTDDDSIAIAINAVNDAPVNTVPAAQSVNEDTPLTFNTANGNLIRVNDVDVAEGTGEAQVTLSVGRGVLDLSQTTGLSFSSGSNGNASMTFRGSLANINAALAGLTYRSNPDFNGADTLSIVTSDLGNSGDGTVRTDSDSVAITVRGINDAPINTVPGAQTLSEDGQLEFGTASGNAIRISDVDVAEGTGEVEVTLSVGRGILTLGGIAGIQFVNGSTNSSSSLTIRGSLTDVNTALNGLTYRGNADFNGADTLRVVTSDRGNSGDGTTRTDDDSIAITISAVNDAPINTLPTAQTINEDISLVFSAVNGNTIRISDVDAAEGTGEMQVSLSVARGGLSLPQTTGLTFVGGSNNSGSMTIRGSLANINTALNGLAYRGNQDFNGADTLNIVTSDLGNSGDGSIRTSSGSVAITVNAINDAPVNTVPTAQNVNEDTNLVFNTTNGNAIRLSDIDVNDGTGEVLVTLSVANGTLALSQSAGITFVNGTRDGSANLTFTGSLASVNAALNGLTYRGSLDYNGPDTLSLTTDDQGNFGGGGRRVDTDSVSLTVGAVNDAPVLTNFTSTVSLNENATNAAAVILDDAIAFSDPDSTDFNGGNLTIRYSLGGSADDQLSIQNQGTGGGQISFNGSNISFGGTVFGTVDAVNHGRNGNPLMINFNSNSSPAAIEALIKNLTYQNLSNTPAANRTISLTVNDGDGETSAAVTTVITVNAENDAPVNTVPGTQTIDEDTVFTFGNSVMAIADSDAGSNPVRVTLTTANGALSLRQTTGLSFSAGNGTSNGTMTFSGAIAAINAALNGMTYTPTLDYNGPATVQILTEDLGNSAGGSLGTPLSDTDSVNFTISPVNDAPVLTNLASAVTFNENALNAAPALLDETVNLTDVDSPDFSGGSVVIRYTQGGGAEDQLAIRNQGAGTGQIGVDGASISYSGVVFGSVDATSNGVNGNSLVIQLNGNSSVVAVEALIRNLAYQNTSNTPAASRAIAITINDGDGGTSAAAATTITLTSENDAPVLGSNSLTIEEGQTVTLTPSQLSATDADDDAETLVFTVSNVLNGEFRLENTVTNRFTQAQVRSGAVVFVHNGGEQAPAYEVSVSDGTVTTPASIASVQFTNVNDAPTLAGVVSTLTFSGSDIKAAPALIDEVVTLSDADSSNFEGGNLTVRYSSGASTDDQISIRNQGTAVEQIGFNGTSVSFEGEVIGTVDVATNGNNGKELMVSLNRNASIAAVRSLLQNLTYQNSSDNPIPSRTLVMTVSDGDGGSSQPTSTVINVTSVNDPPVITVPGTQTIDEDTPLVFTGDRRILISDIDAGLNPVEVTLRASQGTLTLSTAQGLQFSIGDGNEDPTISFRGTLVDINKALDGMLFTPTLNATGSASIRVEVNDLGNSGDGSAKAEVNTIAITINPLNDAPSISGAPTARIEATKPFSFTPTASDVDGDRLTFTVQNLPEWATFEAATGKISGTPTNNDAGTFTNILITASDGTRTTTLPGFFLTVVSTGVNGSADADILQGSNRNDVISGQGNNDVIFGRNGNDTMYGNEGNDQLRGEGGNDILYGDTGNDVLYGGDGDDRLFGGKGNDQLYGEDGNDALFGEDGSDFMSGGAGNDTLNGGEGSDVLQGSAGLDILMGGIGNDSLYGGEDNDRLFGEAGQDLLYGGNGADLLRGGQGNDQLFGEAGNDTLFGEDGNDRLIGAQGNDVLNGGNQDDFLGGGAGADLLNGGAGNDALYGGDDGDRLFGEAGQDRLFGGNGNDLVQGGEGNDQLNGDSGNDTLLGGNGSDTLVGGLGDDVLNGNNDNDNLIGSEGNDTLLGGAGNDVLSGVTGRNTLTGGVGADLFVLNLQGVAVITDFADGVDKLGVRNQTGVSIAQQLRFSQSGGNTLVTYQQNVVAILNNINASRMTQADLTLI